MDNIKAFIITTLTCIIIALGADEPECAGSREQGSWRVDCNWCYCEQQKSVCTNISCTKAKMFSAKTEPECEGSPIWRKGGCQWCHCNHRTANCTEMGGSDSCHSVGLTCDRKSCPEYRLLDLMATRDCTPVYEPGRCCAVRFRCPKTNKDDDGHCGCSYKGKCYCEGSSVDVQDHCYQDCVCRNSTISCSKEDCNLNDLSHGCRPLYDLDNCCMVGEDCSNPTGPLCIWNEKEYLAGMFMNFFDAPCQECICSPTFKGPYGHMCRKMDCNYELKYAKYLKKGCVPKFFRRNCCPDKYAQPFICPDDSIVLENQSHANPEGETARVCSFGDHTVAAGNFLAMRDSRVLCYCAVPPMITCVQIRR